ncbi:hypothetical protein N4X39_004377 [Salmonella enterica]|nr:hypothetical protein [Salmonella enterica]EKB8061790.1 hypothetical protein [Salmonella enterica]
MEDMVYMEEMEVAVEMEGKVIMLMEGMEGEVAMKEQGIHMEGMAVVEGMEVKVIMLMEEVVVEAGMEVRFIV